MEEMDKKNREDKEEIRTEMARRFESVAERTEEERRARMGQRMEEIREEIKRVKIRMERQEKTEKQSSIVIRGLREEMQIS